MNKLVAGVTAFVAFILGFCILQQPAPGCVELRGAFDIGSGTTRLQVAQVDICQNKVLKQLSHDRIKVSYREDLSGSPSKKFSERITLEGVNAIKDLIHNSSENIIAYSGVATEAFRQAENGMDVLQKLAEKIGDITGKAARLEIITQKQEAELGVVGAAAKAGSFLSRTAIWDIGAGSMQLTVPDEKGQLMFFQSKFGAQEMKESIVKQVKRTNDTSPNPISPDQYLTSKGLAVMAAGEVPLEIQERLSSGSIRVVGIGGVHDGSIRSQTRVENKYTVRDVRQAILKRLDLTDDELGGDYVETDLSNLILVDGFMEHLGIPEVHILDIDMTDGVLVSPSFWE